MATEILISTSSSTAISIITSVEVASVGSDGSIINQQKGYAIWDTGAKCSSIDRSFAKRLRLPIVGKRELKTLGGRKSIDVYAGVIVFGKIGIEVKFSSHDADECTDGIPILIGMDVISNGDFSITNVNGKTEMAFRLPSIGHIGEDYNKFNK